MLSVSNTGPFGIISVLTVNIHDADAHDAGDDDQGEAGGIVVHQQQPVDPCLRTANRKSITTTQRLHQEKRSGKICSFFHSFQNTRLNQAVEVTLHGKSFEVQIDA